MAKERIFFIYLGFKLVWVHSFETDWANVQTEFLVSATNVQRCNVKDGQARRLICSVFNNCFSPFVGLFLEDNITFLEWLLRHLLHLVTRDIIRVQVHWPNKRSPLIQASSPWHRNGPTYLETWISPPFHSLTLSPCSPASLHSSCGYPSSAAIFISGAYKQKCERIIPIPKLL